MCLYIKGGKKLSGEVEILGAKNSILPIIACCVLTKETVVIKNCPPLSDINAMLDIVRSIGGRAVLENNTVSINCADANPGQINHKLTHSIRSSIFILGPILSRFNKARVSRPGGCEIGKRPIDLHLEGLEALGVKTQEDSEIIDCDGTQMQGATINLKLPSVGATENIMMAAVLIKGKTVINNAAKEPEISDLASFINFLGGRVYGAGSETIVIEGVKKLGGGEYTPIFDRIVAGTYLAACGICGGKIKIKNVEVGHIYSIIDKLQIAGCRFTYKKNAVIITSNGELNAVPRTSTMPYPGFPTDMQAQLAAMLTIANGKSVIVENLFESRFRYAGQLKKLGANIEVIGTRAVITGVRNLVGCEVEANDLRGGAALVIAGLRAEGCTKVYGEEHISRGYYRIENDLALLGADIGRIHQDRF